MPNWLTDGNPDADIGANSFLGTRAADPLRIRTNNNLNSANVITITPAPNATTTGNVGIGITGPQAKLHISSNEPQLRLDSAGNRASMQMVKGGGPLNSGWDFGVGRGTGDIDFWFGDFTSYRLVFQKGTGNVGIGTATPTARLCVNGDVVVTGDIRLQTADCAEDFDVAEAENIEPGTVVVIDEEGAVKRSQQAYDKRVAGVVSGASGFKPGIILDKQGANEGRMPIALIGKVYCMVDARPAPIGVGDLLTTSSTPGRAMKVDDPVRASGATIGKALKGLAGGQGLLPILVSLQ